MDRIAARRLSNAEVVLTPEVCLLRQNVNVLWLIAEHRRADGRVGRDQRLEPADHLGAVARAIREQVGVDGRAHRVLQVLQLRRQEPEDLALAVVAIRLEVGEDRRAGVFLPLRLGAVEHIDAGRADRVRVAVARHGGVQGVFERDGDEVAAAQAEKALALRQLVKHPVVVIDVVFRPFAHDRFPVGSDALADVRIRHLRS
jgi:hypothetical protein